MENNDQDIVTRLRSLGEQPIDPDLAARHTSYLSAASPFASRTRRRPAVTAAFVAGVLLGGTGLAAAVPGPLPTQASSVAKSALQAVQLADDEPKDPAKEAEKAKAKAARAEAKAAKAAGGQGGGVARHTAGCDDGMLDKPYNHGQYVKAHPDDPATAEDERRLAAESNCGKPAKAVANKARAGAAGEKDDNESDDAGKPAETGQPAETGRPASPGRSDSNPPAAAVPEQGSENRSPEAGQAGKAEQNRPEDAGPTTTTAATTTTTTAPTTTTSSSTP